MKDGDPYKFKSLNEEEKKRIEDTKLIAYICEGTAILYSKVSDDISLA